VNNGIITVELEGSIKNRPWSNVGNRALKIVQRMSGIDKAHYGAFIMPNSVDFDGGVALGLNPGRYTFFKSLAASVPPIQVHEMG
jgi:hypothetical protein